MDGRGGVACMGGWVGGWVGCNAAGSFQNQCFTCKVLDGGAWERGAVRMDFPRGSSYACCGMKCLRSQPHIQRNPVCRATQTTLRNKRLVA